MESAPAALLRDTDSILASLRQHASDEHPLLRKLGIRTLYVQAPATAEYPDPVFTANLVGHPLWDGDAPLPLSTASAAAASHPTLVEPLGTGHAYPTPSLSPDPEVSQAVWPDGDTLSQREDSGATWTGTPAQAAAENMLNPLHADLYTLRLTRDPTKGSTLRRAKTTQAAVIASPGGFSANANNATTAAELAAQEDKLRQRLLAKSLARREKRALNESLILGACRSAYK